MKRPELSDIRAVACGRWHGILTAIGVPDGYLNTRQHQPCPSCGGRDRYRFTNFQDNGGFICNQCHPDGGSGFDLIMLVLGCEFPQAVELVASQLGMGAETAVLAPKSPPKPPIQINPRVTQPDRLKRIQGFLCGAEPITQHSPAGRYLQQRGLSWKDICQDLRGLHYRNALDYWTTDSSGRPVKVGTFPALVSEITKNGALMGVHLTYLSNHGGVWQKAVIVEPTTGRKLTNKKMQSRYHGALKGAYVALYPPQDGAVAVCEGIETALAVRVLFGLPTWACLSANGLINVELPRDIHTLYIVADNDSNETGQRAARDLANRAMQSGITVKQWQPINMGHDALDHLNHQQKQTSREISS